MPRLLVCSAGDVLGRRMRRTGCHSRRIATFPAKENARACGAGGGWGEDSNVVCGGHWFLFTFVISAYQRRSDAQVTCPEFEVCAHWWESLIRRARPDDADAGEGGQGETGVKSGSGRS